MELVLQLYLDVVDVQPRRLHAAARAVYVQDGLCSLGSPAGTRRLARGAAWIGEGGCVIDARHPSTRLLRWELVPARGRRDGETGEPRLERHLDVEDEAVELRCDRVDFPPRATTPPHRHHGPGLRYLIDGSLRMRIGSRAHAFAAGDAWYEPGDETVVGTAGADGAAFVRVLVLPARLGHGPAAIYAPEHRDLPRLQHVTTLARATVTPAAA